MADFNEAYDITLGHEGTYDNDPDDKGGETYKGIARNYWPDWSGWDVIDKAKDYSNFPNNLSGNSDLDESVRNHYKEHFWDIFRGDDIPVQFLANELFDTGVNMGTKRSVTFLQVALNVLNRNGKLYPDIDEDGNFGDNTFNALKTYLKTDPASLLYKMLNVLQGKHYIDYMRKDPTQEKYARGWFNRVDFIKG
jgi:lysozyme family protein